MNKAYKNEESNKHTGHRKRLKNKYLTLGIEGMSDREIVELLLFFALPQGDTSPLAEQLLRRYGSLSAVLDAPYEQLVKINGINEHSGILLSLITELTKVYRMDKIKEDNLFENSDKIGRYLLAFLGGERAECTALLCFDTQRRLLLSEIVFDSKIGKLTSAHIRKIAGRALGVGAHSVVIAHNHPSGITEPSENDLFATNELDVALRGVDIHLIEHYIVTDERYIGIKDYIENNGYDDI